MEPAFVINILLGFVNAIFFFMLKFMFDRDRQNEESSKKVERELNETKTMLSDKIIALIRAHEKKIEDLNISEIKKQLTENTKDIEWLKHNRG